MTASLAWVLTLALHSSPHGWYVKQYESEQACVAEMKELIKQTKDNPDVKGIGCVNQNLLADSGE